MNLAWRVLGIIGTGVALAAFGCGKAKQPPEATSARASVPLPDWAPENPSPEFLRAARVLKPMPLETISPGEDAVPGLAAVSARIRQTWPATYALFGSLTDEQIERFMLTKEVRIPIKSLTAPQREALDTWFQAYREAMKGAGEALPVPDDYLVELYKHGAVEDLANVDVGFATVPVGSSDSSIVSSHRVHIWFWVKQPEGGPTQSDNSCSGG
jgi:hypothetical protein